MNIIGLCFIFFLNTSLFSTDINHPNYPKINKIASSVEKTSDPDLKKYIGDLEKDFSNIENANKIILQLIRQGCEVSTFNIKNCRKANNLVEADSLFGSLLEFRSIIWNDNTLKKNRERQDSLGLDSEFELDVKVKDLHQIKRLTLAISDFEGKFKEKTGLSLGSVVTMRYLEIQEGQVKLLNILDSPHLLEILKNKNTEEVLLYTHNSHNKFEGKYFIYFDVSQSKEDAIKFIKSLPNKKI